MIKIAKKLNRKGFNMYALIGGIALMATMGKVAVPSVQNIFMKHRVSEVIEKEKFIKNIYQTYYKGNPLVTDLDSLLAAAEVDTILPVNWNRDRKAEFINNGIDNNNFTFTIGLNADGVATSININPNIDSADNGNAFALATYRGMNTGFDVDNFVNDAGDDIHTYELQLNDREKEGRRQAIAARYNANETYKKALNEVVAAGQTAQYDQLLSLEDGRALGQKAVAELTAEDKLKEWWEYNEENDTFEVQAWDEATGEWVMDRVASTGGPSADGTYYVDSLAGLNAKKLKQGTKVVVLEDGNAVEYVVMGGEFTSVATEIALAVPPTISRFKDLIFRDTTFEFFNASAGARTTVIDPLWGQNIAFTKKEHFWESDLEAFVPHYKNGILTNKRIYLAKSLDVLPTSSNAGDIAFLAIKDPADRGYCGVQETNLNVVGKLYPEAVYVGDRWIYYTPNIGDILISGYETEDVHYWSFDAQKEFVKGDDVSSEVEWWHSTDYKIIVSMGTRMDIPDPTGVNAGAIYYLTKGKSSEADTSFTEHGIQSKFKYDNQKQLLAWSVKEDTVADQIINSLTDVQEGEESIVNKGYQVGKQSHSQMVRLDTGGFIIVWKGITPESSQTLTGQSYDSDGIARGDHFKIADGIDKASEPSMALLQNDNVVVTWVSLDGKLYKKIISEDGVTISPTTRVNETSDKIRHPQVKTLKDGQFVIVWDGLLPTYGYDVAFRIFTEDGVHTTDEVIANDARGQRQELPQVLAFTQNTGFVISYQRQNPDIIDGVDGEGNPEEREYKPVMRLASFNIEGNLQKRVILLSRLRARMTITSDDKFALVYSQIKTGQRYFYDNTDANGDPIENSKFKILFKQFSQSDIADSTAQIELQTKVEFNQKFPEIKMINDKDALIVWQGKDNTHIAGAVVDTSDNTIEKAEFKINSTDNGTKNLPNIAVLDNGNVIVTWQGFGIDPGNNTVTNGSSTTGIAARQFNNAMTAIKTEFLVNNKSQSNNQFYSASTSDYAKTNVHGSELEEDWTWDVKYTPSFNCVIPTKDGGFAFTWSGDSVDDVSTDGTMTSAGIAMRAYTEGHIKFIEWNQPD